MPRKALFEIDKRSVRSLQRQFRALEKSANREMEKEVRKVMETTLQEAKAAAPVVTGRLRDSGNLVKTKAGKTMNYEVRFGGQTVNYAAAVEFKSPFLVPAFDRAKQTTLKDLHRKMDKLLKAASKLK